MNTDYTGRGLGSSLFLLSEETGAWGIEPQPPVIAQVRGSLSRSAPEPACEFNYRKSKLMV